MPEQEQQNNKKEKTDQFNKLNELLGFKADSGPTITSEIFSKAVEKINKERAEKAEEEAEKLIREAIELAEKRKKVKKEVDQQMKKFDKGLGKIMKKIDNLKRGHSVDEQNEQEENENQEQG